MSELVLTGETLSLDALAAFLDAGSNARVSIAPTAMKEVERCADYRRTLSLGGNAFYGINTGFGRFARKRVDEKEAARLQQNLLRSHSTGMGPQLPPDIVRLMMVLRANSLATGYSGVSTELLDLIVAFVNHGLVPVVPTYGSVGASGDLAPLAHMSLPLTGEGEVEFDGERLGANEALERAGLQPHPLEPKEGLALINGTQLMTAFAVRDLVRMRRMLKSSMCAAAMSLEAYEATDRIFDERVHALKRHPGEILMATGFRRLHEGSAIIEGHRECHRVQDPYSFRCIPQVLGAVLDMMEWVSVWVTREINAVTDNPILFPDDGEVISGGNFHGEHMAFALDSLALAAAEMGSIAERRVDKLIDNDSDKLPDCLIKDPGLNSGLMITQYLAAALVSENKVHAHPASVDSIPTSMGFEDHVSMGSISALKLSRILDNTARVICVELLCGAQALDFHTPTAPGAGTRETHAAVRVVVPFIEEDTVLSGHLESLERIVADGSLVAQVEKKTG
ncbi:MAG: histidine ammonia-lyase, partial [Candidatus Krumholzibacteriota bacterium]|nr:histidine ammonia-lyase [Candidatus Krumholzibacteriota bacterium]